jgi:hypothetical protein
MPLYAPGRVPRRSQSLVEGGSMAVRVTVALLVVLLSLPLGSSALFVALLRLSPLGSGPSSLSTTAHLVYLHFTITLRHDVATLPTKDCVLISFNSSPELGQKIVEYIREELHLESCYYTQVMDLPLTRRRNTRSNRAPGEPHSRLGRRSCGEKSWNFQGYDPIPSLISF